MYRLKVSVGPDKPNKKEDVLLVQKLLNASQLGMFKEPLKVDGAFDAITAERIGDYQRLILGIKNPSGIVDPGEKTITALLAMGRSASEMAGKSTAVAELVKDGKSSDQPAYVKKFVDKVLPAARKVKQAWGVPVGVLLAQSAFESGWGQHVSNNAYFGVRGRIRVTDGKRVYHSYLNFADAADDYGRLLKNNRRYGTAFQYANDPVRFVQASATDPFAGHVLARMIRIYGLEKYDRS